MPTYATSVQNEDKLWMGSAKVEVSLNSGSSWDNLGIARAVSVEEIIEFIKTESDNAPACKRQAGMHTAKVSFTLLELVPSIIDKLRGGGLDTVTDIANSEVVGHDYVVASGDWAYNEFIEFDKQMGDGTCPTLTSVVGGTNATLVEEIDYITVKNGNDKWGIICFESGAFTTESQNLTIKTTYTPSSSVTFSTGGLITVGDVDLRFTNIEYIATVMQTKTLWIYKAYIASALNMAFKKSGDADQAMEVPFEFEAELDTDRTAGDQLLIISDDA